VRRLVLFSYSNASSLIECVSLVSFWLPIILGRHYRHPHNAELSAVWITRCPAYVIMVAHLSLGPGRLFDGVTDISQCVMGSALRVRLRKGRFGS
jgi:hypothetical protein